MDIALDQCVDILSDSQRAADEIMLQMQNIAETIPEYKVLLSMNGVGDRLGPVILAEIGDIRRFHSGKALNAYAMTLLPTSQDSLKAGIVTSPNVAIRLSERLVLRLCRPLN